MEQLVERGEIQPLGKAPEPAIDASCAQNRVNKRRVGALALECSGAVGVPVHNPPTPIRRTRWRKVLRIKCAHATAVI